MRLKKLISLLFTFSALACQAAVAGESSAEQVLEALKLGNQRYMTGKSIHVRIDPIARERTARHGQKPIATVLGCSDARVPPEVIFDQGFGELFIIRVAGNVCSTAELASVEYGVKYLKTPLVVVLGHSKCGAVDAAVSGAELKGSLPKLIEMITPAVTEAKSKQPAASGDALLNAAIEANVRKSIADLLNNSPGLKDACDNKTMMVVGAVRDIEHGGITWLNLEPQH